MEARRRQRKAMEVLAKTMDSANIEAASSEIKAKTIVEATKGADVKTEGTVLNGEKKEGGLKDSSKTLQPAVNGEMSGTSDQKPSETKEALVNGEIKGEGEKSETAVVERGQLNGHSKSESETGATEKEGTEPVEKRSTEPATQLDTTKLALPNQQEVVA